jgi:CheY-like chemotaxis protein
MMKLGDMPIRRRLMVIILATSVVVMVLMSGAFVTYEITTIRQTLVRQATTLGEVIAANSTAALAFDNQDDAKEILAALSAERYIVAACLYDKDGHLFSRYPDSVPIGALPPRPGAAGYRFADAHLTGFQPVVQGGNKQLGTLYLDYDAGTIISDWLSASFGIGAAVLVVILAVAYLLSRLLQQQISEPILALADTARAISDRRDYSVRATRLGNDELGLLTEAFNQMLGQIQEFNQGMEQLVARRTSQLEAANKELESFLSHHGYRVMTAADGTEAVALFAQRSEEVSILITDLSMPNLDGASLANVARRLNPDIKILAMSGLASGGLNDEMRRFAGAFLVKPFKAQALLTTVDGLLHRAPLDPAGPN